MKRMEKYFFSYGIVVRASDSNFHPELGLAVLYQQLKLMKNIFILLKVKKLVETPRALEIEEIKRTSRL